MDFKSNYDGFFFDMDGVLYLGGKAIPGAPDTLRALSESGKRVAVITNNSGQSEASIRKRLERLGFSAEHIEVVSALSATASWLGQHFAGATAFVVGAPQLREEIARAGLTLCEDPGLAAEQCEVLVIGNDRRADYARLTAAIRVGRAGASVVVVNRDRLFPVEESLVPGAAGLVASIAAGIERPPDILIGKPSPLLLDEAIRRTGLDPKRCLMVGDNLETDITMGHAAGIDTALVLTGVESTATLERSSVQPTYVLQSVVDLIAND